MELRGAWLERGLGIDDERQHLVLDLDQPQRVLGDLLGVGGHRRDLLADEADGLLEEVRCPGTRRRLGGWQAQDGPDAVQRLGLRGVDLA